MLIEHPAVKKSCDIGLGHVTLQPILPGRDNINIVYHGPLAQNSSSPIYLHVGFSHNPSEWFDVADYQMQHTPEGYQYTMNMQKGVPMRFCFRNDEDNWDTNHGANWSVAFEVF